MGTLVCMVREELALWTPSSGQQGSIQVSPLRGGVWGSRGPKMSHKLTLPDSPFHCE